MTSRVAVLFVATVAVQALSVLSPAIVSAQTACVLPPPGLVSWWPGNQSAADIVGSNHGTLVGGATFAEGKVGDAFELDGLDGFVNLGPNSIIGSGNSPFTLAFWLHPTMSPTGAVHFSIMLKQDSQFFLAFTSDYNLGIFVPGDYVVATFRNEQQQWWIPLSQSTLLNQWTHLTATYNGGSKSALSSYAFFINGSPLPTGSAIDLGSVGDICNTNALGGDAVCGTGLGHPYLQGLFDEVQVFDRVLSTLEIQSIANAGVAGVCKGGATGPSTFWLGLKNSDDQGTQFDLRTETFVNDVLMASSETRCITDLTRNAALAKEVTVPGQAVSNANPGDTLSVRVSTRIGTNPDDTKCSGPGGSHKNAVGLRLYYDGSTRPSGVSDPFAPAPGNALFLRATGTTLFLDGVAPSAATAKFKDSPSVNFAGGNPWKAIGTWTVPLP